MRNLPLLVMLFAGVIHAQTPNLQLTLPDADHNAEWSMLNDANWVTVDSIFGVGACGDSTHAVGYNPSLKSLFCQTMKGPYVDPIAYGADPAGAVDSTTAWNSAINYAVANSGTVICIGVFKLNRAQLKNATYIEGIGDINGHGCSVIPVTDAAFVTGTPSAFLQGVTIKNIKFIGGTNPIDLGVANDVHVENVELFNFTGCGVAFIAGERASFIHLVGSHTGNNGFAPLCIGDPSKSLFGASQSFCTTNCGAARTTIDQIFELGSLGGLGFSTQWLLWAAGNGLDHGSATKFICFFSCTTGVIQIGSSGQQSMQNEYVSTIDLDHIGQPGTPVAVAVNFPAAVVDSVINGYDPAWNTNYATVQMFVDSMKNSTISNSQFLTTIDNVTTFGLKFGSHSGGSGTILSSRGGLFVPTSPSFFPNNINIVGSDMTPTNIPSGAILSDMSNTGAQISLLGNEGNTVAATQLFTVKRGTGSGLFTIDVSSDGTIFKFGEGYGFTKLLASITPPTVSSGFGTSPSVISNNGTATFRLNVGTGGTAKSGIVAMNATAANFWNCSVDDITAAAAHVAYNTRQTGSSTTTVTVENQTTSTGAAIAWAASDILAFQCAAL